MADGSVLFKLSHILHELAGVNLLKLFFLVDVVDHSQVNVIRSQAGKQIRKGLLYLYKLPGTDVLAVLPGGADVPLNDPFVTPAFDGRADVGADVWLRHPAVQNVDAVFLAAVDDGLHFLRIMALQPLGAEADLARQKARVP